MLSVFLTTALMGLLLCIAAGHSQLGYPKPTSSKECRLGGMHPNIRTCPGPCDTRAVLQNPDIKGPNEPAAVWGRGQQVTIKYQRNNHGPGGFVRLSLVPIMRMMKKDWHSRNAFHYSCWGGGAVRAKPEDTVMDRNGFSMTGSDGQDHNLPIAYYSVNATVPTVIPDGVYALGWVWYGGVGGTIFRNTPSNPFPNGFFEDNWSCSFVQIRGGSPLGRGFTPVFANNMQQHWGDSCWSAHDAPGGCKYGPCRKPRARLMKPKEFANGNRPKALRAYMFRSPSSCSQAGRDPSQPCRPGPVPRPVSPDKVARDAIVELVRIRG